MRLKFELLHIFPFLLAFGCLFTWAFQEASSQSTLDYNFSVFYPPYPNIGLLSKSTAEQQLRDFKEVIEPKIPSFEDNHEDLAYREAHKHKDFYKEWRKEVDKNEKAKIYKEWKDRKNSIVKWLYGSKNEKKE